MHRLLNAPRTGPGEDGLGPALDELGGEVVRLRARDGLRLAARWLPAQGSDAAWAPDPHEAILLLHGYSGSIAPDLVEYGPFLRRTAGVLGLDFRGHGGSDDGPSTFGLLETEDIAGALAWLGERGITRVALVGTSMGGIAAIAAAAVLGDGTLAAADGDPTAPRGVDIAPRPVVVGVVADSTAPELEIAVGTRVRGPLGRFVAARLFDGATRVLGADPRATEPSRVIGLLETVPLLLIHGEADTTVPMAEGRRLAALAGPASEHWIVPGAGHSGGHAIAGDDYERRVSDFLRLAFRRGRGDDVGAPESGPIIAAPGAQPHDPTTRAPAVED
ncbi:MAG: alpha/beta fold hydrolase [Chloroflexi bacterium]|nr:alpha/beta fold hydrolase [Chloroflexota bacterium]